MTVFSTPFARIRFIACVKSNVIGQSESPGKTRPAETTLKRFLSCVSPDVVTQGIAVPELFEAVLTPEGFLSGVNPEVSCQILFRREFFVTRDANKFLHPAHAIRFFTSVMYQSLGGFKCSRFTHHQHVRVRKMLFHVQHSRNAPRSDGSSAASPV